MGREYAGVLGPLAFLTVAVRGVAHQASIESTLLVSAASLFLFAGIGYLFGQLAGWIVLDSVRSKVAAELAAQQEATADSANNAR